MRTLASVMALLPDGHTKSRRYYRHIAWVCCALSAGCVALIINGPLSAADGPLLDLLVAVRAYVTPAAATPTHEPVVIIALDQGTLDDEDLARYPRVFLAPIWATILDAVFRAGARAIGFDLLFAYSANRFIANFDQPFLEVLGKYRDRVVLGRSATTLPARPFLAALHNDSKALGLMELSPPDMDGRYRHVRASHLAVPDGPLPGLANALLQRAHAPAMPDDLVLAPRRHLERLPTYAVIDVLRCAQQSPDVLRAVFTDTIVLIGSTLPEEDRKGSSDWRLPQESMNAPPYHPCGLRRLGASIPDASNVPGVFLHAAVIEAVVSGRVTMTVPTRVVTPLTAVMAALGTGLGLTLTPWWAVAAVVGIAILLGATATGLLVWDVWLPLALPLLALVTSPGLAYAVRFVFEEKHNRFLRRTFSTYLAPELVEQMVREGIEPKLGGSSGMRTAYFTDIASFSSFSEVLNATQLVELLNEYLSAMTNILLAEGGTLDKYEGDAIVAFFGAPIEQPDHAARAVRVALAMQQALAGFREQWCVEGEKWPDLVHQMRMRIGISSGDIVTGNMGSTMRMNYTMMGDVVNTAARLEAAAKHYGIYIHCTNETLQLAGADDFEWRSIDKVRVVGKSEAIETVEIMAHKGQLSPDQTQMRVLYQQGLEFYRQQQWDKALAKFVASEKLEAVFSKRPTTPSRVYIERCEFMKDSPPSTKWDGVWTLTSK